MKEILLLFILSEGFFLCYKDIKTCTVPLWGLLLWIFLCCIYVYFFPMDDAKISFAILVSVSLFLSLYQYWRRKEIIGIGDLLLLPSFAAFLPLSLTPWFLISSGLLGVATRYLYKKDPFPFLPSLFISGLGFYLYTIFFKHPH